MAQKKDQRGPGCVAWDPKLRWDSNAAVRAEPPLFLSILHLQCFAILQSYTCYSHNAYVCCNAYRLLETHSKVRRDQPLESF